MSTDNKLVQIYQQLFNRYGPQFWWPADEPFEVIVGAILTQSTAWINVEKAISQLKKARVLNPVSLRELSIDELAKLIRSSGYYNVKARKLKAFVERLGNYNDSLEKLFAPDIPLLRKELLSIYGIGQETADSIILYAASKPIFVIDAYTHDERLFNEYHALLVRHGKEICRKSSPLCHDCCLSDRCQFLHSDT
jgi:endonuclease-3 related protein